MPPKGALVTTNVILLKFLKITFEKMIEKQAIRNQVFASRLQHILDSGR